MANPSKDRIVQGDSPRGGTTGRGPSGKRYVIRVFVQESLRVSNEIPPSVYRSSNLEYTHLPSYLLVSEIKGKVVRWKRKEKTTSIDIIPKTFARRLYESEGTCLPTLSLSSPRS